MTLAVGTTLGPYQVTAKIGEGGMGEVWQATDTKLDRDVGLKVLPEAFTSDPDRLARFEREAKVLASLNHPNIGSIYGLEEAEGIKALVLELVEGPTLADRITQGPIPLDEALPIAKQIAEALEAAHEAGMIHRDLKPANIKVREDGTVKVLDFGLAKALDPAPDVDPSQSPTLTAAATQMGVIMGTAAYMSPEQVSGLQVDKRADIWALGVVLFEMLTGRRPFEGETVSHVLAAVLKTEPGWAALPTETPAAIQKLLRRCLAKERGRRVPDIGMARFEIDDAITAPATEGTNAVAVPPLRVWQRPMPLGAGILVLLIITGLAVWNLGPSEPRAVTRFAYDLLASQQLRNRSRAVLAISPDGRRFVYNAEQGLYLRSMDTLEARLLPGTEEPIWNPGFSPDGQSLVDFAGSGGRATQLKRLSLSGGAPVVLSEATTPFGVSWETDGTILLGQPAGIMRVSATGGSPELVIPAAEGERFDGPQMLPDGDTVLFSVSTSGGGARWDSAQIVAQSLTSDERTVLIDGGSDARYISTGHLVYALADGLFAVAFDANSVNVVGGPVSLVQGVVRANNAASANYMVSDDGTLFYLADSGGSTTASALVWLDRAGTVEILETIPPKVYGTPRLSPDGEQVLVVADRDVWVYDLASGRETRVTTDGETELYADWTPSGSEVTYTSSRESVGTNIWIEPADGSGPARQLTALDGLVHFDAWAPDGRTFSAHHHRGSTNNQLMVQFDGTNAESEVWLDREFTDSNAVFSPDGRYVAYLSRQTGQSEIYIRPFPGSGGQTPVSVGGGVEPAWAPSGELFYRRPGDYAMMAVDVSTDPTLTVGPLRELFRGTRSPGGSPRARYAVTADGQRFLMSADPVASGETGTGGAASLRVIVVQNWIEELRERVPIP